MYKVTEASVCGSVWNSSEVIVILVTSYAVHILGLIYLKCPVTGAKPKQSNSDSNWTPCNTPHVTCTPPVSISVSHTQKHAFLISKFRRVLNVECFLLGNSPPSEFYIPTFRNTLLYRHRQVGMKNEVAMKYFIPTRLWRRNRHCFPKRQYIKFRRRGITQKKAFNESTLVF
jgi:hypothetical protein